MAALVFTHKLKASGRHARLRIKSYYSNVHYFASVELAAHHHRRTVNDWLRKSNKSRRGRMINNRYTGSDAEVLLWAGRTIMENIPKLRRHGYAYLLIEASDLKRLRVYKKLLERRYKVEVSEDHEFEGRLLLEVSLI